MNASQRAMEDKIDRCELFPDTPGYCDALVICKRVTCSVTFVGAIFTLTIIILFKKYREFTQRLIANLSFASFIYALSFIISDFSSTSRGLCVMQAALMTYVGWVILLSSMLILLSLYSATILQKDLRKLEKYLLITCWAVPVIFAALPFASDKYGPAGVWCWIRNDWGWRFGIWYIWKLVSDLVFFIAIIHIWIKLLRKPEERSPDITPAQRHANLDDIKTLRIYPIVYFLIFLLPTINRIVNAVAQDDDQQGYSFVLLLLHSITAPMFGAVVALTFVLDKRTRSSFFTRGVVDEIRRKWRKSGVVREFEIEIPVERGNPEGLQNPTFPIEENDV